MRGAAGLLLLMLVAGCGDRRSFDERYSETASNIEQRAQNLDAEINATEPDNRSREEAQRVR